MEALHKMIGVIPHHRSKLRRSFVLAMIAAGLLIVAIVFGSTSNFLGAISPLKSSLNINLASWPSYSEFVYDHDDSTTSPLVGFTFTAGSLQDVYVDSITFTGYMSTDYSSTYEQWSTSLDGFQSISIIECVETIWLEDYSTGSIITGVPSSRNYGETTINGLNLKLPKGETKTIVVYGNMSNCPPYLSGLPVYIAFDIADYSDVVASSGSIISRNIVPTLVTHNAIPQSGHPYAYIETMFNGDDPYFDDDDWSDYYPNDYEKEQNPYGLPSFDPEKISQ